MKGLWSHQSEFDPTNTESICKYVLCGKYDLYITSDIYFQFGVSIVDPYLHGNRHHETTRMKY